MAPGDELCSVANVMLYRGIAVGDDAYLRATKYAVEHNMKIRRVFNLIGLRDEDKEEAAKVIQHQIETFTEENNNFQWRFLTSSVKAEVERSIKEHLVRIQPVTPDVSGLFYALFVRNGSEYFFYRTEEAADPRRLHLCSVKTVPGRDSAPTYSKLFEALWNACEGVGNPFRHFLEALPSSTPESDKKSEAERVIDGVAPMR